MSETDTEHTHPTVSLGPQTGDDLDMHVNALVSYDGDLDDALADAVEEFIDDVHTFRETPGFSRATFALAFEADFAAHLGIAHGELAARGESMGLAAIREAHLQFVWDVAVALHEDAPETYDELLTSFEAERPVEA